MNFEEETKREISELSKKVDAVLRYLHNDDGTGELGLVAAFKIHEKKMDSFLNKYETEKAVRNSKLKLIAFLFGGIGTFLTLVAEALIDLYANKKLG